MKTCTFRGRLVGGGEPSFLATHLIRDSSHFIFILMGDEFCFLKLRKLTLRELPLGICFAVRGAED